MRHLTILLIICTITLIACRHERTQTGNGVNTENLVKKIITNRPSYGGFVFSDSSEFTYDAQGRISKELFRGSIFTYVAESSVSRDANGILTSLNQKFTDSIGTQTRFWNIRYDYGTHHYLNRIHRDIYNVVVDSIDYNYTGDNITSITNWVSYRSSGYGPITYSPFFDDSRVLFTYDASQQPQSYTKQKKSLGMSSFYTMSKQTIIPTIYKNTFYAEDKYSQIIDLFINGVNSSYLPWELESVSPYLPSSMNLESITPNPFTLNWQYTFDSENRVLTRSASGNGQTLTVYYKY